MRITLDSMFPPKMIIVILMHSKAEYIFWLESLIYINPSQLQTKKNVSQNAFYKVALKLQKKIQFFIQKWA